ncbi:MAG: BMP family ABC transporter substrate-binding protein, partial [Anaerolineae bacterium]
TDDGRAFGESLMDEGADVIMPVAGPVGLGTAAAIQERGGAWIVGVDTDWTVSAPEFADIVLTSVLKRLDTAVYSASEATVNGTFEGGLWIGDLANDGVGISDPAVAVDGLDAIIDGIIAGSIPTHPGQEMMAESMVDGSGAKVCQITDVGGIDDKSFNATAWLGVELSVEQFGVEGKFLESQQQADYEKNIDAFIGDACDLIVTVGFLLGDATAAAAEANPDQDFVILDFAYDPAYDNVQGVVFASNQNAFLAGYAAATATESGIVATYGGINIPPVTDFMDGYVLGVNYYNEQNGTNVQVLGWDVDAQDGLFTGNFESTDDGRAFADSLMDEGADVIFPLAGAANIGTASAVQERGGAWVIGVDSDFAAVLPEFADVIFMSTLKRLDTAVVSATKAKLKGEFEGGIWIGTLENDGVGITTPTIEIPGLEDVRAAIIAGDIVTTP